MARIIITPSPTCMTKPIDFFCGGELYVICDKFIYGTNNAIRFLTRFGLKRDEAAKYVTSMRAYYENEKVALNKAKQVTTF